MRLLHVIASAKLEGGGPIEGVRQRARVLHEMGHETELVCLDAPAEIDRALFPMPVHALGPSRGGYRFNDRLAPWLRENATRFDAVTAHGIWQQHDYAVWQALHGSSTPYFVFPHGMLDPWFKRAYPLKHLKKTLYWPRQHRILRDAAAVLFTCEEERLLARGSFRPYRVTERVVQYGTAAPEGDPEAQIEAFLNHFPRVRGRPFLLCLGRVHPKKGHDLLIEAYAKVHGHDRDAPELVIAGPDQIGWQASLESLAVRLGVGEHVVWTGMVSGDVKVGAYRACEAFVLPSHQENFGIVVAEALACGRPVLLTDKVNIWREVVADRAGFVARDTLAGVVDLLTRWRHLPEAERSAMGERAAACFARRFEVGASARSLVETVGEFLGR